MSLSGGPSRISLSRDMASAAGEVLLMADRLCRSCKAEAEVVAAEEEGKARFGGGVGASELDLCLCGDRFADTDPDLEPGLDPDA